MKLGILSTGPNLYSTRRLVEAARDRGHQGIVLDTLRFSMELQPGTPDLYYKGTLLPDYDAILPRIGASITGFGTAVVRQFEQLDVYTPNSSTGIANSRDKLRSLQILSRHDVGIPHTMFARRKEDVLPAIERVGGAPVII
ncbi:MAG: 30S ribosomal protein S6--L-glutamate ligase, partial [Longimicrobiales bacterium]